jgi:large subunit ribosomal protein L9
MPRGLAVKATKGGVKHVESLQRAHSVRVDAAKAEAEQVAQRLLASPVSVPAHAGEEGKLFGSVTPADVAVAIESQTGIRVDRHDVHMDESIRSVGVHEVKVHLFAEVDPIISVEVVASPE